MGFISFLIGFSLIVLMSYLVRLNVIKEAKSEANDIVSQAQQKADELIKEKTLEFEEFKHNLEINAESQINTYMESIESLKSHIDEAEKDFKSKTGHIKSKLKKKRKRIEGKTQGLNDIRSSLKKAKEKLSLYKQKYNDTLKSQFQNEIEDIKTSLATKTLEDYKTRMSNWQTDREEEIERTAERKARKIIEIALNRFMRPYCSERGHHFVNLINEKVKNKIFGPDNANFKFIEKECGVDLIYNEEMNSISISGFDPARRELTRLTLEKLLHEKTVDEKSIQRVIVKTKKSLFKKIKMDGTKLFRQLKLNKVSPNIINMMGALRYRYSYAQNQYFHCSEVGFLCGLLSAELNLDIHKGRRAGVLHDLGKAMDHSIDGGHAVIGADFIEKNGEANDIVHAVRAHHYDVQPSTPLCYLVIAADALSGARPGARRSTADAYMQKMGQLEEIGNSFKEVTDTYIMSAGREVRIMVNSRDVDDRRAITLSKEVAKKIEDQCNYPGLIKVTVVRKSEAIEMAK